MGFRVWVDMMKVAQFSLPGSLPSASDHLNQSAEGFNVSLIFQEVPKAKIKRSGLNCLGLSLVFHFSYTFHLWNREVPPVGSCSSVHILVPLHTLCQMGNDHQLQDELMRHHLFIHS